MRNMVAVFAFFILLAACKKGAMEEQRTPVYSEANYQITVTGKWNANDFNVPAGVHFTLLAGVVHNNELTIWRQGALASKNLEYIAENGNSAPLLAEVDSLVRLDKALAKIAAAAPPPNGSSVFTTKANTNYFLLSFASMLAPTPDWFFGSPALPLYRNRSWVKDTTVQLYAYDAGTEEGDVFGYNNSATYPQQLIALLSTANASVLFRGTVLPIAEMRIQKQE